MGNWGRPAASHFAIVQVLSTCLVWSMTGTMVRSTRECHYKVRVGEFGESERLQHLPCLESLSKFNDDVGCTLNSV